MRLRLPDRGERGERGAIAVLTALLAVVVLAMAALGVDIATQVNQRQKLHDTIDAAALAGAYQLPTYGAQAKLDALAFAAKNDPAGPPPVVVTLCVVGSKFNSSTDLYEVDTSQISATCNRAVGTSTAGAKCNASICSLPCDAAADRCNVIRVVGIKPVPFSFAPAIGINQGSTGSVTSGACKGSCGTTPLNPMDVVVVTDHTGSMNGGDIDKMITGITGVDGMFQVMTPSQQYVSLGTIGRSKLNAATTCLSEPWDKDFPAQMGPWIPVPFSHDYLMPGTKTVNSSSTLVKAVNCLTTKSGTGTYLASPMKSAARYLLGLDPNNLPSPETRTGTIRKAIIFETDGAPNESNFGGSAALSDAADIGSTNGVTACTNFTTVASNAKTPAFTMPATPAILVVTVAFNITTSDKCNGSSGARLDQTLAAAASPAPSGVASDVGSNNCAQAAGRNSENTDGDYFFCAGTGTDMAEIFRTAFGQLATAGRLIQLPE